MENMEKGCMKHARSVHGACREHECAQSTWREHVGTASMPCSQGAHTACGDRDKTTYMKETHMEYKRRSRVQHHLGGTQST